jgi:hypothetical protein
MAGSPDADWLEAMRTATVEPVVHCSIALSGTTMDFHNWASGGLVASITGDPLLSSITSVTQQVDPIERSVQASELSLELLDDGKIRGLVATQNFLNSIVTIKLGTPSITLSKFELIFKGPIVRLQPAEGKIIIKVQALESMIKDKKNFRTYYNKHPFEIVDQMLQDSGVASGDIDSTSFTPSTYSADISHYCFSSMVTGSDFENDMFWDYETSSPNNAASTSYLHDWTYHVLRFIPFVDEVLRLTRTSMFVNTAGKVALKHFDASEAVVKHFTTDDYSDFEQVETDVPIYNKMNCAFRNSGPQRFVRKDSTSITNYEEQPYETPVLYLAPYSNYYENGGTPQAGDIVPGFAGVKNLLTSQSTEAPSADRPVYWLHRQEVIKATGAFTATNQYYGRIYAANGDVTSSVEYYPRYITMSSVATRPFFGNQSGEAEWGNKVWDLTATYDFCDYVLTRFSNTAPAIRITTTLEFAYLEIGDLVSLDNDVFLSPELALDGLDSSVKFEVVGREITPLGDSVNIVFDLVYATKTSPPSTSLASQIAGQFETMMPRSLLDAISNGLMGVNSVGAGLVVGAGSGLEGTIEAGSASAGGQFPIGLAAQMGFTAIANRHNYVGINGLTGEPIVTDVATSDPEPRLGPSEIRLGLAVAGGSSISSVSDLRQIGNVSAEQINKEAIAPGIILLWNPGFDIWPDTSDAPPAWDVDSGAVGTDLERSTTQIHSGRYSAKVLNTSTIASLTSSKIPVNSNKPYRAAAWVYLSGGFDVVVDVFWFKSDRSACSTASTNVYNATPSTGAWVNISGVVSPPSDAAFATVRIRRDASPGNVGYFDDVSLTEEPVSFMAYGASVTALSKDTLTLVKAGNESHDYGGHYDETNYEFTAPGNGTYEFSASIKINVTSGPASGCILTLKKDTSVFKESHGGVDSLNDTAGGTIYSGVVELQKGDEISFYVTLINKAGTIQTGASETYFSGRKIS